MLSNVFSVLLDISEFWRDISALALVLVNLSVLACAIFFDWPIGHIVFIFWCETLIVGFFNIFKILFTGLAERETHAALRLGKTVFYIIFFMIHFGAFLAGHLFFIFVIFKVMPFDLFFSGAFSVMVLFLSHGISFVRNYLKNAEYRSRRIQSVMLQPYGRIALVHIYVIAGASLFAPTSWAGLVTWFIPKIILDLLTHRWEYKPVLPANQ